MKIEKQLDETYQEFKDYLNDKLYFPELYEMCSKCEIWCGDVHDYEECRHKVCFKFFLGTTYLEWCNSFERD